MAHVVTIAMLTGRWFRFATGVLFPARGEPKEHVVRIPRRPDHQLRMCGGVHAATLQPPNSD